MESYEKIIFLDIDGVLKNRTATFLAIQGAYPEKKTHYVMDTGCVQLFKYILDKTDSKFVISSSWRKKTVSASIQVFNAFDRCGFIDAKKYCVGVTPRISGDRGVEIAQWLEKNPTKRFVILDDYGTDIPYKDNLVCPDTDTGLTVANVYTAIKILTKKM